MGRMPVRAQKSACLPTSSYNEGMSLNVCDRLIIERDKSTAVPNDSPAL